MQARAAKGVVAPLRVIAGQKRGMSLHAPKGERTRPTTDRVKESLFAILTPLIEGADILDLFAGSGALAIEALSRGANSAILVDKDPAACACIKENLCNTRLFEQAKLLNMSVARSLQILSKQQKNFHIIFMDPPYERGFLLPTLQQIVEGNLVVPGGLVVAEHSRKEEMPSIMENLACVRQGNYGDTTVSFLRCQNASRVASINTSTPTQSDRT